MSDEDAATPAASQNTVSSSLFDEEEVSEFGRRAADEGAAAAAAAAAAATMVSGLSADDAVGEAAADGGAGEEEDDVQEDDDDRVADDGEAADALNDDDEDGGALRQSSGESAMSGWLVGASAVGGGGGGGGVPGGEGMAPLRRSSYEHVQRLGAGSYSEAFLVRHIASRRMFVVKEALQMLQSSRQVDAHVERLRWLEEVAPRCETLVRCLECWQEDCRLFLATEWCERGSVPQFLQSEQLDTMPEHMAWRLVLRRASLLPLSLSALLVYWVVAHSTPKLSGSF
jgi:hypothetical protein